MDEVITYTVGDASQPATRPAIIAHVVNDVGAWGAGFTSALARYPLAERDYRGWRIRTLGAVLFTKVSSDLWIVHMCAQRGLPSRDRWVRGDVPLDIRALDSCLATVADYCDDAWYSIHMPRIGCGLAGGKWEDVGPLVEKWLGRFDVTVYDPKPQKP